MIKSLVAAAALCGTMFVSSAMAAPLAAPRAVEAPAAITTDVQYRETTRIVERRAGRPRMVESRRMERSRMMRPRQVCTVRTERTRTPRGVVVRKVRTCR